MTYYDWITGTAVGRGRW